MLLIYWMLNAGIFILLYSTKSVLFDDDLRILRILYLTETDVEHFKHANSTAHFPLPYFPVGKNI